MRCRRIRGPVSNKESNKILHEVSRRIKPSPLSFESTYLWNVTITFKRNGSQVSQVQPKHCSKFRSSQNRVPVYGGMCAAIKHVACITVHNQYTDTDRGTPSVRAWRFPEIRDLVRSMCHELFLNI